MTIPFPVEPDETEQAKFYAEVDEAKREREYRATEALLAFGADWRDVQTILEFWWPQSSNHQYLTNWASESLDRLHRNAQQRRGYETAAGKES